MPVQRSQLLQPIAEDEVNVSRVILKKIKALIKEGKLAPGDRLPGERQLMSELNIGRSSLREALQALQATGFVKIVPGKGTFIQEPSLHSALIESMMWPWLNGGEEAFSELFQVRSLLEIEAASLAAEGATAEVVSNIRTAFDRLASAMVKRDVEEMAAADVEFHRSIFLATGNKLMLTLIDSIAVPLHEHRLTAFRLSGGHPETVPGHAAILEAIEAGDPQSAREAMAAHLTASRHRMLRDLARFEDVPLPAIGDGSKEKI